MATSELGHYVRFDESEFAHRSPVDTGMSRRAIGNLDHLADQKSRILVNWPGHSSGYYGRDASSGYASDEWNFLWRSNYFDLHVQPERDTYRVRCAVRISSNHATDQAQFRFGIIPAGNDERSEVLANSTNITTANVTATTYSWADGNELVYLNERQVAQATRRISTVDSIGGAEVSVPWLRVGFVVWGKTVSALGEARVAGAFAMEYLNP